MDMVHDLSHTVLRIKFMILAITILRIRFMILAICLEDSVYDLKNTVLKIREIILALVMRIRFNLEINDLRIQFESLDSASLNLSVLY